MSLRDLWAEFEGCEAPALSDVPGRWRSQLVGPLWLRLPAPVFLAVRGMPFWAGKRFESPVGDVISGVNVLEVRGFHKDSLPLTATVEGRDLVVRYSSDAPWPWPAVVDRLRVRDAQTLLGMTFGLPLMPPKGAPFLLRREGGVDRDF